MIVTKYTLVELDPMDEINEAVEFLGDSLKTDGEPHFKRLKDTGPYIVFLKAEPVETTIDKLLNKEQ